MLAPGSLPRGASWRLLAALGIVLLFAGRLQAQENDARAAIAGRGSQDLKRLTIEELADLTVTSVGKRVERLSETAAAVSVIRGDDIRRSGVVSLAQALRLADGLHVAQVYGPGWAISARGFNIATANKLLVLIDGRTIYSPLFSGVFWDVQDVVLADIDRIEVIRGPGGALWGANAVNGVINIITKSAADTQGTDVTVGAGTEARAITSARYGGTTRGGTAYRLYGKFRKDDQHVFATGAPGQDDVTFGQTGFRVDSRATNKSTWTVQGDAYHGTEGLFDRGSTKVSGGNLLTRWARRWSPTSQLQAQAYFDRTDRRVDRQYLSARNTVDVDVQQQNLLRTRHRLVFGAGFRASRGDDLGDGPGFFFDPQVRTSTIASFFAQDDIVVIPDRLAVIVGSKLERNDFTGFEVQPNIRIRATPTASQTIWAAVSRAVRMPTRFDSDLRIRNPTNGQLLITGSDDFQSEGVVAVEGGYRLRPTDRMSIDAAVYGNRYSNLRSQELPVAAGQPIVLGNGLNAKASGIDVSVSTALATWWQAHASYSYQWKHFTPDNDSHDVTNGVNEGNDPSHLFSLRSSVDLPHAVAIDAMLRYVSRLPEPVVAAYAELSVRLGWQPSVRWDLSIVGDNLLHRRHEEFAAGTPRELFERNVFGRVAWHF